MSIMTIPEENRIGITTHIRDKHSEFKQRLTEIQVGDELVIFKVGSRMGLRRENKPIVLISMGVGLSAMRPLVYAYHIDSSNIPSLHNLNINSSKEYLYREDLDVLQNERLRNYWLDSRASLYNTISELAHNDSLFYIVGSDEFLMDIIDYLRKYHVPNENIVLDKKDEVIHEFLGK